MTHVWGAQTRVCFDYSKEQFCILHRLDGFGEVFKLLGVMIDPKLNMGDEIERIKKKVSPKISAILASKWFYDTPGLIQQYKAHVLSLLEQSAGAIYHAADSHLDVLDSLQRRFLREIGLSENNAFLKHNLAPLRLRRDIAVLSLLHRIQLGEAHDDFSRLFEKATHPTTTTTRHSKRRHGKQFRET